MWFWWSFDEPNYDHTKSLRLFPLSGRCIIQVMHLLPVRSLGQWSTLLLEFQGRQPVDLPVMVMLAKTMVELVEMFITHSRWLKVKAGQIVTRPCTIHPLLPRRSTRRLQHKQWRAPPILYWIGYHQAVAPNKHRAQLPRLGKIFITVNHYCNFDLLKLKYHLFIKRSAAWSTHAAAPGYSAYEGISPSRSPGNFANKWNRIFSLKHLWWIKGGSSGPTYTQLGSSAASSRTGYHQTSGNIIILMISLIYYNTNLLCFLV